MFQLHRFNYLFFFSFHSLPIENRRQKINEDKLFMRKWLEILFKIFSKSMEEFSLRSWLVEVMMVENTRFGRIFSIFHNNLNCFITINKKKKENGCSIYRNGSMHVETFRCTKTNETS